jgi:hypothetical protein
LTAHRTYLDQPHGTQREDRDVQIGVDYYYDNLFENKRFIGIVWSNAGLRKTNFSLDDYDALLWTGNVKVGVKSASGNSIFLGYVLSEWTYVPKYEERWWENSVRLGGGVRFYPISTESESSLARLFRRFHLYVEALNNIVWLGNEPNVADIRETDLRAGLGFSSCGFFRHKK